MKKLLLFLCIWFMIITISLNNLIAQEQYQLIWSDEFDGTELSTAKWGYQIGTGESEGLPHGWGNNELQYYRSENVRVEDGIMHFDIKNESYGGSDYTSARVRTKGKLDFTYGKIEARIQFPYGQGFWSAFWMLPTNSEYGVWAASGEIDICEVVNEADEIHGTLHYGGTWPANQQNGKTRNIANGSYADTFHVYGIEWEEKEMRWYCDGEQYGKLTNWYSSGGAFPKPFDKDFHILLNVAVGGNWPGNPNSSTVFPQVMKVDWVRVYQKGAATGLPGKKESIPQNIHLEQNYPNPFNPNTIIRFSLPQSEQVELFIYNALGQVQKILFKGDLSAGVQTFAWDGTDLFNKDVPSGIYYYTLKSSFFSKTKKMILMR